MSVAAKVPFRHTGYYAVYFVSDGMKYFLFKDEYALDLIKNGMEPVRAKDTNNQEDIAFRNRILAKVLTKRCPTPVKPYIIKGIGGGSWVCVGPLYERFCRNTEDFWDEVFKLLDAEEEYGRVVMIKILITDEGGDGRVHAMKQGAGYPPAFYKKCPPSFFKGFSQPCSQEFADAGNA